MSRTWRLPVLVLLPVLLVAGFVLQASNDASPDDDVRLAEMTPTAAAPDTLSSTWYCAAGTATGDDEGDDAGPAEQTVIVSNASATPATGVVTVYPEDGEPTRSEIDIPAFGRTELAVADVVSFQAPEGEASPEGEDPPGPSPWAAALVEVAGGEIAVSHELLGPTGRSVSDCASSPSANWYFPGGETVLGSEMWLALFNPFPGEATVDLTFDSDDGVRTPEAYEGVVVPGGGLVVAKVSDVVTEKTEVSTTVSTRSGRIVAEQVQAFEGRGERPAGLTSLVGATTPAATWSFPAGAPADVASSERIAVFNPGDTDTTVLVQVQLDDSESYGSVEPFELLVPARRVTTVDLTGDDQRIPSAGEGGGRAPHWVLVRSGDDADVVAQRILTGGDDGITYSMGIPVVADRWLAAVPGGDDVEVAQLSVANPSASREATFTLRHQLDGEVADVESAVDLVVAPGERVVLDLIAAELTDAGGTIEVVSDSGVVVGLWVAFSDPESVATPLGVPVAGTLALPVDVVGPEVVENLSTDDLQPSEQLDVPTDDTSGGSDDTAVDTTTDDTASGGDGGSTDTSGG